MADVTAQTTETGALGERAPLTGALGGLRVLDLTRVLAGPVCAMMLGDMGADVLKVEPVGQGDDTRTWGPPFLGGESAYFLGANRNKRGMTLNMAVAAGQAVLARLIARSDVLVENFRTGTLARWGFDDAWFEAQAPTVVRCSITGYGTTGPKAAMPGYDFILQAESGLMSICGEPDGAPMKYGVAIVDLCTGMLACNAILGAIAARSRTGRGQRVEVSLFDTGLFLLANVASNHLASGREAGRYGNGHPNIVPYTAYPVADGMIAVAVGNDAQFRKVAELIGHAEWGDDPRFRRNQDRVTNRQALDAMIAAVLQGADAAAWIAKLQQAGIPCGRINTVSQALADPHAAAREMIRTLDHPAAGEVRTLGIPFRFSATPASIRRPPPMLSQHTDEVLASLGYTAVEIEALKRDRIV
jgi:crotonobetainyl-CoA:carnitine CoA-transferase CaiB-like acyl-CoA transferase